MVYDPSWLRCLYAFDIGFKLNRLIEFSTSVAET